MYGGKLVNRIFPFGLRRCKYCLLPCGLARVFLRSFKCPFLLQTMYYPAQNVNALVFTYIFSVFDCKYTKQTHSALHIYVIASEAKQSSIKLNSTIITHYSLSITHWALKIYVILNEKIYVILNARYLMSSWAKKHPLCHPERRRRRSFAKGRRMLRRI